MNVNSYRGQLGFVDKVDITAPKFKKRKFDLTINKSSGLPETLHCSIAGLQTKFSSIGDYKRYKIRKGDYEMVDLLEKYMTKAEFFFESLNKRNIERKKFYNPYKRDIV